MVFLLFYLNDDLSIDDGFEPDFCYSLQEIKDSVIFWHTRKGEEDPIFKKENFRYAAIPISDLKPIE